MIRKVKFSNFYSFAKEQEIDFMTTKKQSYDYFRSRATDGRQITKVAGFIGGNASGKTNVMRFFGFLNYFVCQSSRNNDGKIGLQTFFNNEEKSEFYVEFEINDNIYFYEFGIKNENILYEKLSERKNIKNAQKTVLFFRDGKDKVEFENKYFVNFSKKYIQNIRGDVSLVSYIKAGHDIEIINSVYDYFVNLSCNISEGGSLSHKEYVSIAASAYIESDLLKLEMEEFVRRFDIGLDKFEIREEVKNEKVSQLSILGFHKTNESKNTLSFNHESRGTQSLFYVLSQILIGLKKQSIVVIDEIETGLHPEAIEKLIRYFIDENESGKAQLIFSSNSLGFMRSFDRPQIFLNEKNGNGESLVYRLDEVKNTRPDENFFAKYMTGAYGAFPNIKV